ncbi:MAG: hypothetical protein P9L94_14025 [Candidatus Hinthialibacter antarcticus]|nr:hypothetical protein [Candidatus Hinthialibacter antarcticus]
MIALAVVSALAALPVCAQTVDEDFDVVAIPIGGSLRSGEHEFGGPAFSLADMGLEQVVVPNVDGSNFPEPAEERIQVSRDRIEIELLPGEAVRFLSQPMVVSTTSVFFTSFVTVENAIPEQIGTAFLDIENLGLIGVALSLPGERKLGERRELSAEFQPLGRQVQLLLQCVGPAEGSSQPTTIAWERLRVLDGFRSLDLALGATALTRQERFSPFPKTFEEDETVTTPGGFISAVSNESHLQYPKEATQTLLIAVKSATDVVRAVAPLERLVIDSLTVPPPQMLTAQMWAKRRSGAGGVFSIALGSAQTTSIGVYEMLVDLIPVDRWVRLECQMFFDHNAVPSSFLFLQLREGASQILIDDITLRGRRDARFFWDESLAPPGFNQ